MKFLRTILSICLLFNLLSVPVVAAVEPSNSADTNSAALERLENLVKDQEPSTFDEMTNAETLTEFIGLIISVVLGLLGVIFMALMLWAGYTWMTAGGNEEKVSQAGHAIKVAIIGLLIVIGSFAIWRFVFERIINPTT